MGPARHAWAVVVAVVALAVAQGFLLAAAGVPLWSAEAVGNGFPGIPLATVVGALVGAVILSRHPRHPVGWLFCLGQLGVAMGLAARAAGDLALARDRFPQAGRLAEWVGDLLGSGFALTLLAVLLLLAPDGRLPSRRWRPALLLTLGSYALLVATLVALAGPSTLTASGRGPDPPPPAAPLPAPHPRPVPGPLAPGPPRRDGARHGVQRRRVRGPRGRGRRSRRPAPPCHGRGTPADALDRRGLARPGRGPRGGAHPEPHRAADAPGAGRRPARRLRRRSRRDGAGGAAQPALRRRPRHRWGRRADGARRRRVGRLPRGGGVRRPRPPGPRPQPLARGGGLRGARAGPAAGAPGGPARRRPVGARAARRAVRRARRALGGPRGRR